MTRSLLLLLASLIGLLAFLLRVAGFLLVGLVKGLAMLLRAFSRATTTTSVRVSPGRSF